MTKLSNIKIVALTTALSFQAEAAVISYEQVSQVGNRYEYSYQVTNDNIADGIDFFSLYYDYNLYDNIAVTSSPDEWDPFVLQADTALLADGLTDWSTFTDPLAIGENLIGFNVAFDFLGADVTQLLQSQSYDIFDGDFNVLESGFTGVSNVPEPGSFILLSLGLVATGRYLKVSKKS